MYTFSEMFAGLTSLLTGFHRAEVSDMVGAGDYDYDDDHDLPAGCQYMDPQSF